MATYQAVYDYKNSSSGMLSFRCGDKFLVRKKTNDDWWEVESENGTTGLVPVSYLELVEDEVRKEREEGVFTALYDFTGQDSSQLTFKKGEQLQLQSKSDVSWWTMKSLATGLSGYVPLNYIDVPMETTDGPAHTTNGAATTATAGSTTTGSHDNSRPHPHNAVGGDEALSEVLLSVDRAMQKIHDEATLQGGSYTSQQRATLQQLATHRKSVVEEHSLVPNHQNHQQHSAPASPNSHSHKNTTPSPSLTVRATNGSSHTHSSPRPKRKAPAPPTNHTPQRTTDQFSSLPRKARNMKGSRSKSRSKEDLLTAGDYHSSTLPSSPDMSVHRDRSQTQPHAMVGGARHGRSGSQPSLVPYQNHTGTAVATPHGQPHGSPTSKTPSPSSPQKTRPYGGGVPSSPQRAPHRRVSEQQPSSSQSAQRTRSSTSSLSVLPHTTQGSPGRSGATRSKSVDTHPPHPLTTSPSHQPRRPAPIRTSSSAGLPEEKKKKITLPPGLSPKSSPLSQRRHVSMTSVLESAMPPGPALPTHFPASDGTDLIEVVRSRTQLSYPKSVQAVTGVLELLKEKLPTACSPTMDALLSAVQQSQANTSPSTARKVDSSSDMARLREIFFQLRDVKEDSQQRGWAVHDDLGLIMEYLSELLQILCDADQEITRAAVKEDKYENILILISYYDIEPRIPIRLLMLQVFGVLCGLDREIITVFLGSTLPNELGRDINNHLTEIEKTLYSSTVCTMIFSTGEAIPLTVYDQWNEEYISFLMDTIENPPAEDGDEQLPDAFLNVILSFNQHFTDPESNPVMSVLKTKKDPRHFSEKFMFLFNRGDDPVALQEPQCPDSLTKFAQDIFFSSETSGMFYTTDLMVLIDIVLRQISDLCPGDEIRSHYLELLCRIVGSTDYRSHGHRQREITGVLNRISQEEGGETQKDRELVKKIWVTHPGCFDEITDL